MNTRMKTILTLYKIQTILILLAFLNTGWGFISRSQPLSLKSRTTRGELYSFVSDRQYWGELSDYCVKDHFLYIYFQANGVLKIYDEEGTYRRSYAQTPRKGSCALRIDGEFVYFFDEYLTCYIFSAGEWVDTVELPDYDAKQEKLKACYPPEEQRTMDGAEYYLKLGSVWRTDATGAAEPVVRRPLLAAYSQGIAQWAGSAIPLTLGLILQTIRQRLVSKETRDP